MAIVLIVDDEVSIASLLKDVLTDEGHRVLVAGNGRQALQLVAHDTPDLVITDFMMPVMDGASLIEAMAADATLMDVPAIVMSAVPEATLAQRCSGYVAFVRKPFKIADVIGLVKRFTAPH